MNGVGRAELPLDVDLLGALNSPAGNRVAFAT